MAELAELKQQRSSTKASISRIKSIVESNARGRGKPLSQPELKCRLGLLESYFKQLLSFQTSIEKLDATDSSRADLEELYIATKMSILAQLDKESHNESSLETTAPMPSYSKKLPNLKLPTFSGKYTDYKNFMSSFTQIIDRETQLSNIEKFNHLLNCLTGPALEAVQAFPISNENYIKALDRLKSRYDNNTLIFMENITTLFEIKPIGNKSGHQLRSLVDHVSAIYGALNSLGTENQICDSMLICLIMQKVDDVTRRKWKESLKFDSLPRWDECLGFLDRHCQFLESMEASGSNQIVQPRNSTILPKSDNHPKRFTFATASRTPCLICQGNDHYLYKCPTFKTLNVQCRQERVKELSLCQNCLSSHHNSKDCKSPFKCRTCSRSHHTLLHRDHQQPTKHGNSNQTRPVEHAIASTSTAVSHKHQAVIPPDRTRPVQHAIASTSTAVSHKHQAVIPPDQIILATAPVEHAIASTSTAASHKHQAVIPPDQIILATALVWVKDASGGYQLGRALLDSCSQVNLITEEFSKNLCLPRSKQPLHIMSIGETITNIKHQTLAVVKSRHSSLELPLNCSIVSHIAYQPSEEIDTSSWKVPLNTPLADEQFFKSKRIDLLLGTETFFEILSVGQIKLGENLPVLQKTLLGWVVAGKYKNHQPSSSPPRCLMSLEDTINKQLELMWKIEELQPTSKQWTPEQTECENLFIKTVRQTAEGRVIVRLPFKENPACLGLTYSIAQRRFLSLECRLSRQPEIKESYIEFMKQYEELGHMTRVETPKLSEPHYYIPHHCVFKPSSTSTKLRVVFDASCPSTSQLSLNNVIMAGPTVQPELFHLLLQFRSHRYVLTADIVKMFRQMLVDKSDRQFQYILWRDKPSDPLETYELNTVTYGTASAPFLAIRSLNYLADKYESQYPVGAAVIKSSFYVDDLLGGADSVEELSNIKREVTSVLAKGCLQLDKWHSNHPDFVNDTTIKDLKLDSDTITSALGIKWDQAADAFLFSYNTPQNHDVITKRTILSLSSSLFDPLGLLVPIVIVAKIIMQELWLLQVDWDESVPQTLFTAWETFVSDLTSLQSIKIPRYCFGLDYRRLDLHGFSDASIRAYGSCIYIRSQDSSGKVTVKLYAAKSRVAPTKKKSLPKLELCAALLLAKLYEKIKAILGNIIHSSFLWTDSTIVLHWLKQHSATLSTFVGNRVSEIQDLTSACTWRHVPTKDNTADIVSRGATVHQLLESSWFTGPAFLLLQEDHWPINKCEELDTEAINMEKRRNAFIVETTENYLLKIISNCSSFNKIVRIIAYLHRFYHKAKKHINFPYDSISPSPQERLVSLHCIAWIIQQTYFATEINRLQQHKLVEGALKNLNPFLQKTSGYELLKVGGRLEKGNIDAGQRHPILLPKGCAFVETYVRHLHFSNYHAGPKVLVALTRLNFWIVNVREVTRRVVRSCIHCARYKPKLLQQVMGNLPVDRLTPNRPFARLAVDFCGPIATYLGIRGKTPYKTYIAIFVCMCTKAVHIEAVSDLSTDAFIAALKRLIGRRGLPTDIYCDNATNFVGANNKLTDLKEFLFNPSNQNTLKSYCNNQFINFNFIPPRAPHFGGLWEAAVKSAKGHLNRTLQGARLTFEGLTTALVEIEAIMNSRPISPISSDPSDCEALTPAHFIIGSSLKSLPERELSDLDCKLVSKWTSITAIKQHFWRKWMHDYINELQIRTKWTKEYPNLPTGALVIIHDDNLPPQQWLRGRVLNCIPGSDDRIRVVDVRTTKGVLRRPIHKIALLPS